VARRCVGSRNLENEEAKARYRDVKIQPKWVVTPRKQTNKQYCICTWYDGLQYSYSRHTPRSLSCFVRCTNTVVASKYSRNHFLINTEQYNHVSYTSFIIAPSWTFTVLQATVSWCKNSWKPFCESVFSSSIAFLLMSVTSQMRLLFSADFSRGSR